MSVSRPPNGEDETKRGSRVSRGLSVGLSLAVFWLFLSGYYQALLLTLGAGSILLCVYIARRMDIHDHEGHPVHLALRGLGYIPWLTKEIVVSNLHVARVILDPKLPINPKVVDVPANQHSELGHVIYANSITLTPGTVTIGVRDRELTVHALTNTTREGLETGDMGRRVCDFEGADPTIAISPVEPTP